MYAKLLKSYAIDAMLEPDQEIRPPSVERAQVLLHESVTCTSEAFPSVGHGDDHRARGPRLVGSALLWNEAVIHAAFFRADATADDPGRISSARNRRSSRA